MIIPDLCLKCYEDSMYPHFHPGQEEFWKCLNCHAEISHEDYERRHIKEEEEVKEPLQAVL